MFFNSRKDVEPVEEIATDVWKCKTDECSGWARKKFFNSEALVCPFCEGPMESDTKMLPALMDTVPNKY